MQQRFIPGGGGLYVHNPHSPIAAIRAGVDRDSGGIARMYYLTRLGAEQVAELWQAAPETVFYPRGDKLPLLDVLHRALTIDCWIELQRFAEGSGGELEFFHPYFRTTGANRSADPGMRLQKLTRIDFPAELARKHKALLLAGRGVCPPAPRRSASSACSKPTGASTPAG